MYDLFNNALKTSGYIACDGRMVSELRIGNNMKGSGCVLSCYDGLCIEELRNMTETSNCPPAGLISAAHLPNTKSTATFGCFSLGPGC